nr:hypothetical protein [Tanacetum cinerariifolium]
METMNVSFDELSAMAFEQSSSKPGLQCMTSGQISSGLDLTYAPSTIMTQQPTEGELDLLFEAMYDDYFGGQPSAAVENVSTAQEPQKKKIMETMNVSFDELSAMAFEQRSSKPGLQCMTSGQISSGLDLTYAPSTITKQQPTEGELDLLFEAMYDDYFGGQPLATVEVRQTLTDVVELNPNAMIDGNTFVNPFATSSSNAAETSSSQNVDPSNMHTFYQPYPHEFQWTKDYPLEQVIGEPSRPVLTRNQLRSDGNMCLYALT